MRNNFLRTLIFLPALGIVLGWLFVFNASAQTPDPNFKLSVCGGHGGVNCSVINPDASVVCNDGTIDESFFIYGVPECQGAIEELANKQSDFMAETGCFPPSEMTCINDSSYEKLFNFLRSGNLESSELGKNQLAQCRRQIEEYKIKNSDYQQCLSENKTSGFSLVGVSYAKPLLKTIFCPLFYGEKSYYDGNADLCLCETGYFMTNNGCEEASLICQIKYGQKSFAQNGSCYCEIGYELNADKTRCIAKASIIRPPTKSRAAPTPTPTPISTLYPLKSPAPQQSDIILPSSPNNQSGPENTPSNQAQIDEIRQKQNFFIKIISSFIRSIMNLF